MFIRFSKMSPHTFGWNWRSDQRILLVGLYYYAVGFDFGLQKSAWFMHFNQNCKYCAKPLRINSRTQIAYFHGECRTPGRAFIHRRDKLARFLPNNLPWYKTIFT